MVEVFKTNVEEHHQAALLEGVLSQRFPLHRIDFDLEDCDRILRVEGTNVMPGSIIDILRSRGYCCEILD